MILSSLVVTVLLATGVFFLIVAAVGFMRLPDVFCRLHVTGVMDTLGAPLILLGAMVHVGPDLISGKLLLIIAFTSVTSPLVAHLLARAALDGGYQPHLPGEPAEVAHGGPGTSKADGR